MTDCGNQKKLLRTQIRAEEKAMSLEEKRKADESIQNRLHALPEYHSAQTVFCFVGTQREIDTKLFLEQVIHDGKILCVPLCRERGNMELRRIETLSQLQAGAYGILEPLESCEEISPAEVSFTVVPCVSCSHQGDRLGQGGGFYDRFLADYKGTSVLVCREKLMCENIPIEPHDCRIPIIVTDAGVFRQKNQGRESSVIRENK